MGRRGKALGLTCVISLLLAGCQPIIDPNRYGPAPVLNSADVDASAQNQIKVLRGLASASALDLPAASGSSDWYLVMEAGFNYVDEECDRYITDLFIKNRERDRLKGLAVLADKTTSAILAASNASKEAMEIVAQSFGFAEGATDLIANSYLFQIDPAHIQNLVAGMRRAYRQKAYEKRDKFTTPTLAYHGVQKYLELCLPQTIEFNIDGILARAQAFPDPTTPGPSIGILVGTSPPLSQGDATQAQGLPSPDANPSPAPPTSKPAQNVCPAIQKAPPPAGPPTPDQFDKNCKRIADDNQAIQKITKTDRNAACVIARMNAEIENLKKWNGKDCPQS